MSDGATAAHTTLWQARTWLEQTFQADGSWGYLEGKAGAGEPTMLATAALSPTGVPGADFGLTLQWLRTQAMPWEKLLLPAALAHTPGAEALRRSLAEEILQSKGKTLADTPGHDGSLVGWAWVQDTHSWVEPTAYALLSLRSLGMGSHPRVQQGVRLLLDRQCEDGGWNYGNPVALGQQLESFPIPTAWALLALPPSPQVERGLARLLLTREQPTTASLSMAILALHSHGADLQDLPELLARRGEPMAGVRTRFGLRIDRHALATCAFRAIEEGHHAFAFPA
jgi:hypothetical protein